jgi:hypothetical protein
MTAPLYFTHNPQTPTGIVYSNDVTLASGTIQINADNTIYVTVHNSTSDAISANITLYCCGYARGSLDTSSMVLINCTPLQFMPASIPPGATPLKFDWTPDSSILSPTTPDPAHPFNMAVFAQVTPQPSQGGTIPPEDTNPASDYNAAALFSYNPKPFGQLLALELAFKTVVAAQAAYAATTLAQEAAIQVLKRAEEATFELATLAMRREDDPPGGRGSQGRQRVADNAAPITS